MQLPGAPSYSITCPNSPNPDLQHPLYPTPCPLPECSHFLSPVAMLKGGSSSKKSKDCSRATQSLWGTSILQPPVSVWFSTLGWCPSHTPLVMQLVLAEENKPVQITDQDGEGKQKVQLLKSQWEVKALVRINNCGTSQLIQQLHTSFWNTVVVNTFSGTISEQNFCAGVQAVAKARWILKFASLFCYSCSASLTLLVNLSEFAFLFHCLAGGCILIYSFNKTGPKFRSFGYPKFDI